MKIYVITAGEYSDYHICAVTDDPVSAENLRKKYTTEWDIAEVEEYDTQSMPQEPKMYWKVRVGIEGRVHCLREAYYMDGDEKPEINKVSLYFSEFSINVHAKDANHAKKIAFDRIAQFKAEHYEGLKNAES